MEKFKKIISWFRRTLAWQFYLKPFILLPIVLYDTIRLHSLEKALESNGFEKAPETFS